jgi:hypothetical protein
MPCQPYKFGRSFWLSALNSQQTGERTTASESSKVYQAWKSLLFQVKNFFHDSAASESSKVFKEYKLQFFQILKLLTVNKCSI